VNERNSDKSHLILRKFVESGINITPILLDFIITLDNPIEKLNLILKESSYIPSFKSHLTESFLKKIKNEKIKKDLEKIVINKDIHSQSLNSILKNNSLNE